MLSSTVDRGIMSGCSIGDVVVPVRSDLAKHCRLICKAECFIIICYRETVL